MTQTERTTQLSPETIRAAIDESIREDRTVEVEVDDVQAAYDDINAAVEEVLDSSDETGGSLRIWPIEARSSGRYWSLRLVTR